MLVGETNENGESAWAVTAAPDWREVDQRLRGIARRKGALDREELVALRDAMRVQVWREVGCASMREYLERIFGYGQRAASDRLRVASALDAMPALEGALDAGELPYSGVREIARVATSRTADAWLEACRGKCLRDIEELVAQHAAGDLPDSPPREHERPQLLRLEIGGSEYALWRQARQIVEGERDEAVSDRELFAVACTALIERAREPADRAHVGSGGCSAARSGDAARSTDRAHVGIDSASTACVHECARYGHEDDESAPADHVASDPSGPAPAGSRSARAKGGTQRLGSDAQRGRAKYQIAVVVCDVCKRGWQEGGGKRIPITVEDVARAECDAQRIGSLDGDPEAATQDIAPKTRRFVWLRDGGRCTVTGCRASSFIEIHHIVHREQGGGNEAENLTLLCGGHHAAHHADRLVIRGRAPHLMFELAGERLEGAAGRGHAGTPAPQENRLADGAVPAMRTDAVLALHTLGFTKPQATAAVDAALGELAAPFDLERLLRGALRHCPK